ncbi:MAG TPA: SDR family NAD(P)-dependent oxidoreductase [Pedobacter sp.]
MNNINTISILGCGWYGFPLAVNLISKGFQVNGSSTTPEKLEILKAAGIISFQVSFEPDTEAYQPDFFNCDLLIISIPPKRSSGQSLLYPDKISRIKEAAILHKVPRVIFISSTSVYGDVDHELNENSPTSPATDSGKAIWEAEKLLMNQSNFKLSTIRFGGLTGPGRDPGRFFAGKKDIPNGKAPVNMIRLDQCIEVTNAIIEKDAFGYTFNACSSSHPPKKEYYKQAALKSGLEAPEFIDELNEWKIISSIHLQPVLGLSLD